jgi:uncharacterized membrane protein
MLDGDAPQIATVHPTNTHSLSLGDMNSNDAHAMLHELQAQARHFKLSAGDELIGIERLDLKEIPVQEERTICCGLCIVGLDRYGKEFGERSADCVSSAVGSWTFIIVQTCALVTWLVINGTSLVTWDSFPFILLNLMLSFQAAFTGPIIMMSQQRQAHKDHIKDGDMHEKVDHIRRALIFRMDESLAANLDTLQQLAHAQHFLLHLSKSRGNATSISVDAN